MLNHDKKLYRTVLPLLFSVLMIGFLNQCDRLNRPFSREQPGADHLFRNITPAEALALIQDNQNNPDFLIVDVRTPAEYNDGHIENAMNINYYSDSFRDEVNQLDKNKIILIYCRSGARSESALEIMKELDFKTVYNMLEGINGWIAAGYPVVE